jgi:hypothetical protein
MATQNRLVNIFANAEASLDGCGVVYVTSPPILLMKSDKPRLSIGLPGEEV